LGGHLHRRKNQPDQQLEQNASNRLLKQKLRIGFDLKLHTKLVGAIL
jgi:uncharacterized protein YehS (DUF1456 family)